jgi:hypothetical protein
MAPLSQPTPPPPSTACPPCTRFSVEVRKYIRNALAFVTALAWENAITDALDRAGLEDYGPLVFALSVTLIGSATAVCLGSNNGGGEGGGA